MRYLRKKIKAHLGDRLTVDVTKPTRIMVMPEKEFRHYKNHATFTYFGVSNAKHYELKFPKSGEWELVVEKGTYHNPIDLEVVLDLQRADPDEGRRGSKMQLDPSAQEQEQEEGQTES